MEWEFLGRQFVICVMEKIQRDIDAIFINVFNVIVTIAVKLGLTFIIQLKTHMYVE